MSVMYLKLSPRDPIIARDGRPFGQTQQRMRGLPWLYPSVAAGALRTLLGKLAGGVFNPAMVTALKQVAFAGPFPLVGKELFFPAPADILPRPEQGRPPRCFAVRPSALSAGEGCDLPLSSLLPVMLPREVEEEFKPAEVPPFWSARKMAEWLTNPRGTDFSVASTAADAGGTPSTADQADVPSPPDYLPPWPCDERTHVKIDPKSGAAAEGMLFTTVGLDLTVPPTFAQGRGMSTRGHVFELAARVKMPAEPAKAANGECAARLAQSATKLPAWHPLGGERRLVEWQAGPAGDWSCPENVRKALESGPERVRLVLATPAVFRNGWRPGWLAENDGALEGSPPGLSVRLRLVGAALERWQPISGWSLENTNGAKPGPKPVRRLVPAGGVYFFEVVEGDPSQLAEEGWLRPVSDDPQDRRDGFGLSLWGIWDAHETAHD